jgi:glyoxylase-like metal-dependent hydrolase (beta-lactamase superfamily II)
VSRRTRILLLGALILAGCAPPLVAGFRGALVSTTGPSRSMVSVFETAEGILVVDLGWWGAADELGRTLAELGADSADVEAVLLTHAHRDHIAAWPAVRGAPFYLAEAEEPYLFGEAEYEAWVPRTADRLLHPDQPARGDIEIRTFRDDTTMVVGYDTIRAFLVPGHTPGSTAYLIRGILFAGDALAHTIFGGFRHAHPVFSDDVDKAASSLRSLFERLEPYDVRLVCTGHARCSEFTEAFRQDALGLDPPPPGPGPPGHPGPGPGT